MSSSFKRWLFLPLALLLATSSAFSVPANQHVAAPASLKCHSAQSVPSIGCGQAPSSTFDQQGRLWSVWASGGHLYSHYSDNNGSSFSPPVAVNRIPEKISARAESRPKIKIDGRGRIHISWTKPLSKRFSGDIRYSRSDDGGKSFIDPVTVNHDRQQITHRFDSLGVNNEGRVYIAWIDKRDREAALQQGNNYTGAALYYSYANPGENVFQPNIKIADHSCECCRTALDIDPNGLPVLMWRHVYPNNIRDHALVRFTAPDRPATPQRVSYDHWQIDACPHHGPALSIGEKGLFHAVWFNAAPDKQGLFYAYSTDQGQSYSASINIGNPNQAAAHPDVITLGSNVYLTWKEYDGKQTLILLQQSHDQGENWSSPSVVAATNNASDYPLLIRNSSQVFLSWQTVDEGYRLLPLSLPEEPVQ